MSGVSKVDYGDQTLIDLTSDTVDAAHLADGYTAHAADGSLITGEMRGGSASGNIVLNANGVYDVSSKATATYIGAMPFHAYINVSNYYWGYYTDSSTSFCFPVIYGKTYTLRWDDEINYNIYRVAFTKTLDGPSTNSTSTSYRRSVYDASGAVGVEQNGFTREISFTIADQSLKMCVIQIAGTTTLWTTGSICEWFNETMQHLTITVE